MVDVPPEVESVTQFAPGSTAVDQVTLFEADRQVYGPMSLHSQT